MMANDILTVLQRHSALMLPMAQLLSMCTVPAAQVRYQSQQELTTDKLTMRQSAPSALTKSVTLQFLRADSILQAVHKSSLSEM